MTYRHSRPCCWFSGCTTVAPSQADDDCPEPQEVLVSKEACWQLVNVSLVLLLPTSGPSSSGCLSLEVDVLQPANSVPSCVLCAVLAVSYVRAFCVVAIPHSGLLSQVSSLRLPLGHSGPVLTLNNGNCASLPNPHLLVVDAGICAASPLGELPLGM